MSFKIFERGTNRKLAYELLLVVYSNFRRITHHFREAVWWWNHIFCLPHSYLTLNLKVMPLAYGEEIWRQKTRIMGLP